MIPFLDLHGVNERFRAEMDAATARVDAVTSATYSSEAAIANVRAALASAVEPVVESTPRKEPNP